MEPGRPAWAGGSPTGDPATVPNFDADGVVGPATWGALGAPIAMEQHVGAYTPAAVLAVCRNKGYSVRDDGQMNIVGVRSDVRAANDFDDVMYFIWMSGGEWRHHVYRVTTDPGTFYRQNPINVLGTAIMKPGQYRAAYQVGRHKGYKAMQQTGPITVYRDNDKDSEMDATGSDDRSSA